MTSLSGWRAAMNGSSKQQTERFLLWIDSVGGFWVCTSDAVTLGQPGGGCEVDVPILGDLSRRHALIRRDGEGYLIEAIREVRVNGRPTEPVASLVDGSTIELGQGVRLAFRRPNPLSATARLDFASRHRTQPRSDAVLLMADACVLGPRPRSHVVCPSWPHELILYRHDSQLYCRTRGPLEIDGVRCVDRGGPLRPNSRIVCEQYSLSLEAV
jgi:FHA domain